MKKRSLIAGGLALALFAIPVLAEESPGMKYWNDIRSKAHTTESGLQYKIRTQGDGPRPQAKSTVYVHYRGMLMNGVVFDNSYSADEPLRMSLKRVIKGWQEGIPLMPEGSVYTFLIPPELAYGEKGSGGIPPNATLIFDVELYGK